MAAVLLLSLNSRRQPLGGDGSSDYLSSDSPKANVQTHAHALASSGERGHTAPLRFKIYDDSGVAKAVATIKRNGRVVGTAKSGFGSVAYDSVYFVGWKVPRTAAKGSYSFCVVGYDRSAHKSATSCAPLALK